VPQFVRRPGPRTRRRLSLHPAFLTAIGDSVFQLCELAWLSGFRHPQTFSKLLHKQSVSLSYLPQFVRVAELIGYPPDQIFSDHIGESPKLTKHTDHHDQVGANG